MRTFVLDLFGGDVTYGKPPQLPSGLYFFCCRCEKRCKALEAGSDDDAGGQYCRECTRRMYLEDEPTSDLAKNPDFMPPSLAHFNACYIRKSKLVLAPPLPAPKADRR